MCTLVIFIYPLFQYPFREPTGLMDRRVRKAYLVATELRYDVCCNRHLLTPSNLAEQHIPRADCLQIAVIVVKRSKGKEPPKKEQYFCILILLFLNFL